MYEMKSPYGSKKTDFEEIMQFSARKTLEADG
jgi:hypothetical protein